MKTYGWVILGSGVAAAYAVEELVQADLPRGSIAMITADSVLPYDRPPLSKGYLAGEKKASDILIHPERYYEEHAIDVLLHRTVTAVNFGERKLHCGNGEEYGYEKLLLATGSEVRRLDVPGSSLEDIYYLRYLMDSERIRQRLERGERAVVVGGGFIGMEVSSVLARKGVETTLVFPDDRVWQKFFTPEMSAFFEDYYRARGVTLMPRQRIGRFLGDAAVSAVEMQSGTRVPAEFVVAGIGVVPETRIFQNTQLELHNGVVVNEYLETNIPGVWACGDIANYPDVLFSKRQRIEHWDNAVAQGKLAARNMTGRREAFSHVPYFFSDIFDLSYEFWGDISDVDHWVTRGEINSGSFSTWWFRRGRLVGAFLMSRPDEERELAPKWIQEKHRPDPRRVADAQMPLTDLQPAS